MKCPSCGVKLTLTTESPTNGTQTDLGGFELTPPRPTCRPPSPEDWMRAFEEHFWPAYPKGRHVAKTDARKAWKQAMPKDRGQYSSRFSSILATLDRRKRFDWAGREVGQIPYPSTFLRGEEF